MDTALHRPDTDFMTVLYLVRWTGDYNDEWVEWSTLVHFAGLDAANTAVAIYCSTLSTEEEREFISHTRRLLRSFMTTTLRAFNLGHRHRPQSHHRRRLFRFHRRHSVNVHLVNQRVCVLLHAHAHAHALARIHAAVESDR